MMIFRRLCISQKNEVTAVRQKIGPAMRFLFRVDFGGEFRCAALRGDATYPRWSTEENHALATPRAASVFANIAQVLRSPACRLDFEKFSARKIAERSTIRRPER